MKFTVLLLLLFVSAEAGAAGESYEKELKLFKDRDYKNAVVYLEQYVAQRPDPAAHPLRQAGRQRRPGRS